MFFGIDPIYFLFVAPAMLLAAWAQMRVRSAYAEGSQIHPASGVTGAQAAAEVMRSEGLNRVEIEPVEGFLSDHYDPRHKVLRLSPGVYGDRSLAALGIAAHEAGHALQDAHGYSPLVVRNLLVPVAGFGSNNYSEFFQPAPEKMPEFQANLESFLDRTDGVPCRVIFNVPEKPAVYEGQPPLQPFLWVELHKQANAIFDSITTK